MALVCGCFHSEANILSVRSQGTNSEPGHVVGPWGLLKSSPLSYPQGHLDPLGRMQSKDQATCLPLEPLWGWDKDFSFRRGRLDRRFWAVSSHGIVLPGDEEQLCPKGKAPWPGRLGLPPQCFDKSLNRDEELCLSPAASLMPGHRPIS